MKKIMLILISMLFISLFSVGYSEEVEEGEMPEYAACGSLPEIDCEVGEMWFCDNEEWICIPDPGEICTDSDGGENYMEKGTTRGYTSDDIAHVVEFTDSCFHDNWVSEYVCGTGRLENVVVSGSNNCPYGCKDGACLIAAERELINCEDTDGRDNYNTKGKITLTYSDGFVMELEDYCGYSSGGGDWGIHEYYCNTEGYEPYYWSSMILCSGEECPDFCFTKDTEEDTTEDSEETTTEPAPEEEAEECPIGCTCSGNSVSCAGETIPAEEECPKDCQCSNGKVICSTTTEPKVDCLMGCALVDKCLIQGTRVTIEDKPAYCDISSHFEEQKEDGLTCENNFECESNFCSNGKCYDIAGEIEETQNLLERIVAFLKNLFGFE